MLFLIDYQLKTPSNNMKHHCKCCILIMCVLKCCCSKLLFGQVMKKIFKPILAWSTESLTTETSSDEGIDDDDEDMDDSDEDDKDSTPKRAASPRLKVW